MPLTWAAPSRSLPRLNPAPGRPHSEPATPIIRTANSDPCCTAIAGLVLPILVDGVRKKEDPRRSMSDTAWKVALASAMVTWFVAPILNYYVPKILSEIGLGASKELSDLEISIIPELKKTLQAADQERMMQRGKRVKTDLDALDKMATMLRHALEDAEDISDDQQEIESYRNRFWHCLCCGLKISWEWIARIIWSGSASLWLWVWKISFRLSEVTASVVATCVACFDMSCMPVTQIARSGFARLLQCARKISLRGSDDIRLPITNNNAARSHFLEICITRFNMSCMWISSSEPWLSRCCTSIHKWSVDALEAVRTCRDQACEGIGFTSHKENATVLDFVLTAMSIWNLKKRIENVENTVNDVKKSTLLDVATESALEDIANKNRSSIRSSSKRKVFGRKGLRDKIVAKLRKPPTSSNTSPCYSAIGIHGVAGSGKTTFARYTRDYIEEECEEKLFDTIMCVRLSKTFSVDDIFHEMLKDITNDRHTNILHSADLKEKLEESLRGKCFFLILDDLWVEDRTNLQLEQLLSPLNVGKKGSKILVTARTEKAARVLCAGKITKMPDLHEEQYYEMFMYYALDPEGEHEQDRERKRLGRLIAKKLLKSPIAAVTVAGQLWMNDDDIEFWKNTAECVKFDDTMDVLWWSYQKLPWDIRRCLEYCTIFPRRTNLTKSELVSLWIAQGFVKPSATEDMEDRADDYVQTLVSCSFLEPTRWHDDFFTIHDLLHDLVGKVVGSDFFRIENERSQRGEGWKGDVPREVRHLFIWNYDGELITEKIRGLENLRTLIIYVVESGTPVEEEVIKSICKRLPKLRVLIVAFSSAIDQDNNFSFPESIGQLKHLRYLGFRMGSSWPVILPSTLSKLHHIQQLDFGYSATVNFNCTGLINLLHIICKCVEFANIGRLISLQTIPGFAVRNEEGYEVKQLRDLNKLRGILWIRCLENVEGKAEALEANLAAKGQLTKLILQWGRADGTRCGAEVDAEVLEGLCPPVGLETLDIQGYRGSRYPDWMVGKQKGGPKDLQRLRFWGCRPAHELGGFPHLRLLQLINCSSWNTLPGDLQHLTFLKELEIAKCLNIRSLPTLPKSLEEFRLCYCDHEFMRSCQTEGDPNWQKIKDIAKKRFYPECMLSKETPRKYSALMDFFGEDVMNEYICSLEQRSIRLETIQGGLVVSIKDFEYLAQQNQ